MLGLQPQTKVFFSDMLAYQRRMDASIPNGAVLFLGDSITQSLAVAAVAPFAVNLGIGQQTTGLMLRALPEYRAMQRADAIVLTIGINDILHGESQGLDTRLRAIDRLLPADRLLVWNGIMPLGKVLAAGDVEAPIRQANALIKSMCAARARCVYLDTWAILAQAGAGMPSAYLADGIHLSDEGYRRWIPALRHALGPISRSLDGR